MIFFSRAIKIILCTNKKVFSSESGSVVIEFAFILPTFLILIFGIVNFGIVLYDQAILTNAVREGARAGVVASSPKKTSLEIQSIVQSYAASNLITFAPIPAELNFNPPPQRLSNTLCKSTQLTVTASYDYSGIGSGILTMFSIPKTLSASSTMCDED